MARRQEGVAVALVYETRERGAHVRDALAALGAPIVYEASTHALDHAELARSAANVVVVNLDAQSDPDLDGVYGLLGDSRYRVVFNDGDVSSALSGWDQARWTRHLAAKIFPEGDLDPPRPADAEAVPPPVRKQAGASPIADESTESLIPEVVAIEAPAQAMPAQAMHEAGDSAAHDAAIADAVFLLQSSEWDAGAATSLASEDSVPADSSHADAHAGDAGTIDADTYAALDLDELLDFPDAKSTHASAAADTLFLDADETSAPPQLPALDAAPAADFDLSEIEDLLSGYDAAPPVNAREPLVDEFPATNFAVDDFVLEADESTPADAESTTAGTGEPAKVPSGDGFELLFDEDDDAPAASTPPPAPAPAAQEKESVVKVAVPSQWSLEDMVGDPDAPPGPPPTGRADFGIEKLSAAEFLAPAAEKASAAEDDELDLDMSFELMPIEEAVAPVSIETPVRESWLEDASAKAKVRRVWVLAASIGGPEAVREFLAEFPRDYPALFVLAQHLGGEFVDMMTRQLAKSTPLLVRVPTHGDRVSHGEIIVVPAAQRLLIDNEGVVVLERIDEQTTYGPSIDRVMGDIAERFGGHAGAIVFSGMSEDAVEGSRRIVAAGGRVYAQTPETCVVSSMVDAVCESGMVAFVGSPKELAEKLLSEKN